MCMSVVERRLHGCMLICCTTATIQSVNVWMALSVSGVTTSQMRSAAELLQIF